MVQRHSFDPPDAQLALRLSDGTAASTTTTKWYDLGTGYPMGNNVKQLAVVDVDVIVQAIEFAATSSATMVVTLYLTNDEDGSNPGQGNVGGGSTVTRTGLAFIGATMDHYLRAFDVASGKELWRARLPAAANATPATFTTPKGRQIVVVAAGGHEVLGSPSSDYVLAFALPDKATR